MVNINAETLYDADAERAFLGGALLLPDRLEAVASDLSPSDFYVPLHQSVFQALAELLAEGADASDGLLVRRRLAQIHPGFDERALMDLYHEGISPRRDYVEIILRHATARRALAEMTAASMELAKGGDPYEVASGAAKALDEVSLATGAEPEAVTLEDLIQRATESPWVLTDLLRVDWRILFVAGEGAGKSTLLRQIAVCAAQGIHPFWLRPGLKPVRTLIVDVENGPNAIAETGETLSIEAGKLIGDRYDSERCKIWSRPGGLDLRSPTGRGALVRELRAHRPELVVMGPVYKLGHRKTGEGYEEAAEAIQEVLDDLRTRFGFALVLEHHAPKGDSHGRAMAPFGSQRWLAWPEFGRGLRMVKADELAEAGMANYRPDYEKPNGRRVFELDLFRGDRVRAMWPQYIVRSDGTGWPWMAAGQDDAF